MYKLIFILIFHSLLASCVNHSFQPKTVNEQWSTLPAETIEKINSTKFADNWKYIADIDTYQKLRSQRKFNFNGANKFIRSLNTDLCESFLKNWDEISTKNLDWNNTYLSSNTCIQVIRDKAFSGDILPMKHVLLDWAKNNKYHLQLDTGHFHYSYYEGLGIIIPAFAELEADFKLSDNEEKTVYDWIRRTLRAPLRPPYADSYIPTCQVNISRKHFVDDCGSTRFRYTHARLIGSLVTKDLELFETAKADTAYTLSFFDENGVYKGMAVRGGLALHYSADVIYHIARIAEVYATLDLNIYELKLNESGMKLADAMRAHFSFYDDTSPLLKWAKYNKGNKGYDWTVLQNKYRDIPDGAKPHPRGFLGRMAIRYLEMYQPELIEETRNFLNEGNMFGGQWGSDTNALFISNRVSQGFKACEPDLYYLKKYATERYSSQECLIQ